MDGHHVVAAVFSGRRGVAVQADEGLELGHRGRAWIGHAAARREGDGRIAEDVVTVIENVRAHRSVDFTHGGARDRAFTSLGGIDRVLGGPDLRNGDHGQSAEQEQGRISALKFRKFFHIGLVVKMYCFEIREKGIRLCCFSGSFEKLRN